jgi:biopolymer transport protein ExbD
MRTMSKQSSAEKEHPNLTPMLDVVFIMLIFFIVTATFMGEAGIDVGAPADAPDTPLVQPEHAIVVRINDRDRIEVSRREVDSRNVRANIARLQARHPGIPVVIKAHPNASIDAMIHVIDSAHQAGAHDISLAAYR